MVKALQSRTGAIALAVGILASVAFAATAFAATTWNTTGAYVFNMEYQSGIYPHDVSLVQDGAGNITGTGGGHPAGGPHVYTWVIDSGSVIGNSVTFSAHYTATPDAVNPLTIMTVTGTIAPNGTISGTWSDNYQGGLREGTFTTASGAAVEIPPAPVNFTVEPWVYDPDVTGTAVAEWLGEKVGTNATYPTDINTCKKDGWKNPSYVPAFKNQGQCVSYVDNLPTVGTTLSLQKNAVTSTNSAGGAELVGVEGITLTELGFDVKGYCGAGAPRFNVYTEEGTYYFFGCAHGTATPLADSWYQVSFTDADAVAVGSMPWPGFGNVVITGIDIVMDEEGQTLIDNVNVNGTIVGSN